MIDFAELRNEYVLYLKSQLLGPAGGQGELLPSRPDQTYLVGTLYPRGCEPTDLGAIDDPRDEPDDDEDRPIEASNDWRPSSAALSFLHTGNAVVVTGSYAKYVKSEDPDLKGWLRQPPAVFDVKLSVSARTFEDRDQDIRVSSRWRPINDSWLVTVSLENLAEAQESTDPVKTESCLFQVSLECHIEGGLVLPYPSVSSIGMTAEERELALRYSNVQTFAVGHGASVAWDNEAPSVSAISLDFLPISIVPAIAARTSDDQVLSLAWLANAGPNSEDLANGLQGFVNDYEEWTKGQGEEAFSMPEAARAPAADLLGKMSRTVQRMRESVELLRADKNVREAFQISMRAMREQMLQTSHVRENPGVRAEPLKARPMDQTEPRWRPFQLGFLLVSLVSTADEHHADRNVVDLIWFTTGGGKTEAYLALAAFEMVRRRLVRGVDGGGTAVITRYTLRLLTTQQFQRAATLICALQRIRSQHRLLANLPAFSIGLWLGDSTTPNKTADAIKRLATTLKMMEPDNPYQLDACPWCATPMIPERYVDDPAAYGAVSTRGEFYLHCPHPDCDFAPRLPVEVVDEQIYANPPTMLMGTIDKFARLPLSEKSGVLLGASPSTLDPPSLIIQDELHLLSGPLGTTMAVYEAAIQGVLGWAGIVPKIVASTATIRSATEQVLGLFGREVNLYPPSGLNARSSYFAETDFSLPGRLYMGLMPQAFTQSSSVVRTLTALLEGPLHLSDDDPIALDAYWTVVAYHNSLRELGRTLTITHDDVPSLLLNRASSLENYRKLEGDGVVQLTSQESAAQLPKILKRLDQPQGTGRAVDVVVSTNMLSVGIDVARLGVMLMNGQPKTSSEYIQATSRVGRSNVPGVVVTLFRATKPRDRSHYESFQGFHQALYRYVEPTSVTPWSIQSRKRALAAALVILVRHGAGLTSNAACAAFDPENSRVMSAIGILKSVIRSIDPEEFESAESQIDELVNEWAARIVAARESGQILHYNDKKQPSLLKAFGEDGPGWPVMNSMRSVDRTVKVITRGQPGSR